MQNTRSFPFEQKQDTNTIIPEPSSSQERLASPFKPLSVQESEKGGDSDTTSSLRTSPFMSYLPRQLSQLPTPQSPSNFGNYLPVTSHAQDSPIYNSSQILHSPLAFADRFSVHIPLDEEDKSNTSFQQTITPESSPVTRIVSRFTKSSTPKHHESPSHSDTPMLKANNFTLPLETPSSSAVFEHSNSNPTRSPAHHITHLSSPFMSKSSTAVRVSKPRATANSRSHSDSPEPRSIHDDDIFPSSSNMKSRNSDAPLVSSPISNSSPPRTPARPSAGGEMERIRQAMVQDRLAQYQEAESRRPEYLKRARRTSIEANPIVDTVDPDVRERDKEPVVGIMESPVKGRRLKLFQETSEESFEESLMAGGYGRYRTADWVRQPQPILLATPGTVGASNIVSTLEQAEGSTPPTQKEAKKRKRLAAFRESRDGFNTKLHPVELEGRGRVVLDVPASSDAPAYEGSVPKKKSAPRRRKKGELTAKEKKAQALAAAVAGDLLEKPNWPDAEFPWRLRTEERAEELKAKEAEKLKWIERFLDRLSDDEDEVLDGDLAHKNGSRINRAKAAAASRSPHGSRSQAQKRVPPILPDPADAVEVLMSKRDIRALYHRQRKKQGRRANNEGDEEILCICNGEDDGRDLVQCDGCETWYHLQCIGIRDISELGKEEDPWFCHICEESRGSPSSEPELSSEPTFVPTEDHPRARTSYDAPFFQSVSLQASPLAWDHSKPPKTPTRIRDIEYEPGLSSGSSWPESLRNGPSTPRHLVQGGVIYTHNTPTFNSSDHPHPYEESPFDPTSTPSRGIRFSASFATPKNNVWPSRPSSFFQTPKAFGSGHSSLNRSAGTASSNMDSADGGTGGYDRILSDDDSPIRRLKSSGRTSRRPMDSPLTFRSAAPMPHHLLDSPIMRSGDSLKRHELSHSSLP